MLFDKNGFYFMNNNDNFDFAVNLDYGANSGEFYNKDEALIKGNLFPKLYSQYKSYTPSPLYVKTKREEKLIEIQKLDFAINELNLYLDLHKDDKKAYDLFKKYTDECKMKKSEYTKIYGPLCLDELTDEYEWSMGTWPWEEGGM